MVHDKLLTTLVIYNLFLDFHQIPIMAWNFSQLNPYSHPTGCRMEAESPVKVLWRWPCAGLAANSRNRSRV